MRIEYIAFDGKAFSSESACIKHEKYATEIRHIFNGLVDDNFFENYKIPMFIHNVEISNLGKPSHSDWKCDKNGYIRMRGRMGNGDTWIVFKLRKHKLLIFRYETDNDINEKRRYYGCVDVSKYMSKGALRELKLKDLLEN